MAKKKMDRKLVAFTEDDGREALYIHLAYGVPIKVVKETMIEIGKNGKPARSRAKIYAALRLKGYPMLTKKQKEKLNNK